MKKTLIPMLVGLLLLGSGAPAHAIDWPDRDMRSMREMRSIDRGERVMRPHRAMREMREGRTSRDMRMLPCDRFWERWIMPSRCEDVPEPQMSIVINEIYHDPADDHDDDGEWVELYNNGDVTIDLRNWSLEDNFSSDIFDDDVSLAPGEFVLVGSAAEIFDAAWAPHIPEGTHVIILGGAIGNGLGDNGDELHLRDPEGVTFDAVSYGSNTDVFNPSAPDPASGHSLSRDPSGFDSDFVSDWIDAEDPTPGS